MANPLGGIPITVADPVLLPELPRKGDFIQLDSDQVNDGIDRLGWYVDYAVFHNDDDLISLLVM